VAVLGVTAGVWSWRRAVPPGARPENPSSRSDAPQFPTIALSRLSSERTRAGLLGERDLFSFGQIAAPAIPQATLPPVNLASLPSPSPEPPPLNLKYIGSLESKAGLRVAFLLTDRQEVLTGRPGEIVGNRFRIVTIGLESVDIQEVGFDNIRRLPLKGN
jgi:hypothetical protein